MGLFCSFEIGMKPLLHKTGATLLAFLLLFSTLSFSVNMHFCGRSLVDLRLFHQAEGCGMAMDDGLMEAMGCCSEHGVVVLGQDSLELPVSLALQPPPAIWVLPTGGPILAALLEPLRDTFIPFKEYSPPKLTRNISVQQQVFLI